MSSILNITTQILSYSDNIGNTDNPAQRNYDWGRRMVGLVVEDPTGKTVRVAPGATMTVFNSIATTGLLAGDILSLSFEGDSVYSLKIDSGTGSFRTGRAVTGIVGLAAQVQIFNNALARFTFDAGANLSTVVIGDIMRIASLNTYNNPPFGFNDINAGLWYVIAINGNSVDVYRGPDKFCDGVNESIPAVLAGDVKFYSATGVQEGDTVSITGTFSSISYGQYGIVDATPDTIYFTSTKPLPDQSSVSYALGTVNIFGEIKNYLYLETDQLVSVRLNTDTTDNNVVEPIVAGDPKQIGFLHKTGLVYKIEIVNKSVVPVNIHYFIAE